MAVEKNGSRKVRGLNTLLFNFTIILLSEFTIWIHDTFCSLALNPVSFSRIHYESTLFRKFSINSLPVSPLHFEYSIFFANLLWIRFLFCEFAMDSLFNTRIHFEYLIFFCFGIHLTLKKFFAKSAWINTF